MRDNQDVVLVRDKVLAAALFARKHHSLMLFRDEVNGHVYCAFPITRQLRKDIRQYHAPLGLMISTKRLGYELDAIEVYLEESKAELRGVTATTNG